MNRWAVLFAAALLLGGCSKPSLTPAMAAGAIRQSERFREPGFVAVNRQDAPSDCKAKIEEDAGWRALARTGWLDVRNDEDFERGTEGRPAVKCVGALSGDGLRAGATPDTTIYREWRVPAAARELVAIQSITPPETGISTVRFTYRWRLNAFGGQLLEPGPELSGVAVLRLLDVGWQVAEFTALPQFAPVRRPGASAAQP